MGRASTRKRREAAKVAPLSDVKADAKDPPIVLFGLMKTKQGIVLTRGVARLSQVEGHMEHVAEPDLREMVTAKLMAAIERLWR